MNDCILHGVVLILLKPLIVWIMRYCCKAYKCYGFVGSSVPLLVCQLSFWEISANIII